MDRKEAINKVLEVAEKELGTMEQPPFSNKIKYNRWFYGSDLGVYWCANFISWVISHATGQNVKFENCETWQNFHKKHNTFIAPHDTHYKPERGDIVFLAFSENDIKIGSPAHVGIIKEINKDGSFTTIEGNTSSGVNGSQDNGGGVFERVRYLHNVTGFGRHNFLKMMELSGIK